jgi:Transcriptional regulator, AbiEi antitoxin
MRPIPPCPVFSRTDLRAHGWSDSAIARAVAAGRLVRLRRDQFSVVEANPMLAAIAAARACTGSVISHRSAAPFYDVPLYQSAPVVPDLTVQPGCTGDVVGALLHRATLRPEDVADIDGSPVTSPVRTIFDLARHLRLYPAVVALDFALHENLTNRAELADMIARYSNWPRVRRARRALALADERSESVLESVSRLVMIRLRIPTPRPQARVYDAAGELCGRVDFYWDEFGVFGEADGRLKYETGADTLFNEKVRQEDLEDLGLVAVRWGWKHATRQVQVLARRLEHGFERGRRLRVAGSPRLWSVRPEHFPV